MPSILNEYQQAVGSPVPDWQTRTAPQRKTIEGSYCRLEPLDAARHAADLHGAYRKAQDSRDWTYMLQEPFADEAGYRRHVADAATSADPLYYAVLDLRDGRAIGTLALMRIDASYGVIEVGMVMFSPDLQRTPASTEAQYLLMRYVFEELGYRRYEWKCDSLNQPSRLAAARLGFQYEGTFRQARVYKGRNRDTAWFSVIDRDWPALRAAFEAWLAPHNFDADGRQRLALSALRAASGPAT